MSAVTGPAMPAPMEGDAAPAIHTVLLDAPAIAARIPHAGRMCLLQQLHAHDRTHVRCSTDSHRDPHNPLRLDGSLPAASAIEYAAQAMALHGALAAPPGSSPTPGFLASVRGVTLHVDRLDDVDGRLVVEAQQLAGDTRQALYVFALRDTTGRMLVDGRATVILDALPA
jgi:predicted hotdog family 3-hydroxylacyl-ACP dehydratase